MRLFGGERVQNHDGQPGRGRGYPHRGQDALRRHRERPEARWRPATSHIRKNVLQYDDVMNTPARDHLRASASKVLDGEEPEGLHRRIWCTHVDRRMPWHGAMGEQKHDDWDFDGLRDHFRGCSLHRGRPAAIPTRSWRSYSADELIAKLLTGSAATELYATSKETVLREPSDARAGACGHAPGGGRHTGWITSTPWRSCSQGIGLRAYGQQDPVVEYKHRGLRYVRRP